MAYYLVGEAPTTTGGNLIPDDSVIMSVANRLRRISGYSVEEFLRVFPHRTYLWLTHARMWPREGKLRAAQIAGQADVLGLDGVVVIGKRTAECYGIDAPEFAWRNVRGKPTAFIPHPGGMCKFWNSPDARTIARRFFEGMNQKACL